MDPAEIPAAGRYGGSTSLSLGIFVAIDILSLFMT
jgi:hypothetical protein